MRVSSGGLGHRGVVEDGEDVAVAGGKARGSWQVTLLSGGHRGGHSHRELGSRDDVDNRLCPPGTGSRPPGHTHQLGMRQCAPEVLALLSPLHPPFSFSLSELSAGASGGGREGAHLVWIICSSSSSACGSREEAEARCYSQGWDVSSVKHPPPHSPSCPWQR